MRFIYGTDHLVKVLKKYMFIQCVIFTEKKKINWYLTLYSKKTTEKCLTLKNMIFSLSILLFCFTVQISKHS